ncbi:hypothetical protein EGR_05843 [Echinococcus granulosus]|uniref:Uncharacterized protein n=1 Tax=Echinococcus granulosus TaxID=6210 RepID=W6V066_ECHGR|nr:hypothetical protein EGR_05843 [Echinococcus granulosus]EUB59359.1 hypothetical protein EGR_05843 [Echinococcus granulosus]
MFPPYNHSGSKRSKIMKKPLQIPRVIAKCSNGILNRVKTPPRQTQHVVGSVETKKSTNMVPNEIYLQIFYWFFIEVFVVYLVLFYVLSKLQIAGIVSRYLEHHCTIYRSLSLKCCTIQSIISVKLKKTNGKEYKSCPASISESATLLGTADVPNPHGNGICHYAYLLIRKLNEVGNHRSELVTLCIDQSGTAAKDKNNNIKIKFPHENLTYVWVHPTEPRVLGVIVTFKEHESEKMMSKFTAFRMSSKVQLSLLLRIYWLDWVQK